MSYIIFGFHHIFCEYQLENCTTEFEQIRKSRNWGTVHQFPPDGTKTLNATWPQLTQPTQNPNAIAEDSNEDNWGTENEPSWDVSSYDVKSKVTNYLPRKRDVESPRVVEKSDALMLVGPDARHDDKILLSALKSVHRCHLDFCVQLRVETAAKLREINEWRWRSDNRACV